MRVSLAQFHPRKGRIPENLDRMAGMIRDLSARSDLILFPETAVSGYFVEGAVGSVSRSPLAIATALGPPPPDAPDVILGSYIPGPDGVENAAVHLTPFDGAWQVHHVHRKLFLPTYGVFDEARFVVPGRELRAVETPLGRIGPMVCEDMHHALVPTILALDGAEVMVCLAASPARDLAPGPGIPGSLDRWDAVGRSIAMEHSVHLLVCHLAGSEGGKLFSGGSVAYDPSGRILGRARLFREDVLEVEVDRGATIRSRNRASVTSDLRTRLPVLIRALDRVEAAGPPRDGHGIPALTPGDAPPSSTGSDPDRAGPHGRTTRPGKPDGDRFPDPADTSVLDLDLPMVEEALVTFLQHEIQVRRGFQKVVLGLSGGVDSAVSAALAVRALGKENVHAFFLPYRTSSPESLEHGKLVAEHLGLTPRDISITPMVDAYVEGEEAEISDLRRGNLAARTRFVILWDQSARLRALPLGTGNKSERLLGYFTWHADDSPPINPLGDLFKTQVWALARHLGIPEPVIEKAPSADLVEGVHDRDELGISYTRADPILHWLLLDHTPGELEAAGFPSAEVELVVRRLESTHWKRKLPTIAMVSSTGLGEYYLRPVDF